MKHVFETQKAVRKTFMQAWTSLLHPPLPAPAPTTSGQGTLQTGDWVPHHPVPALVPVLQTGFPGAASPELGGAGRAPGRGWRLLPAPAAAAPSGLAACGSRRRRCPLPCPPISHLTGCKARGRLVGGQPERSACVCLFLIPPSAIPARQPGQSRIGSQRVRAEGTGPGRGVGRWVGGRMSPPSPRAARQPGRRRLARFWWV